MSTAKPVNGSGPNNSSFGKRKKGKGIKGSYITKWLDKSMQQNIQDITPSMDTYDSFISPHMNWPVGSQFAPGYDSYRHMYAYAEPMSLPTYPSQCNSMIPFSHDYRYFHGINKNIQAQRPRLRRRTDNKIEEKHSTPIKNNMNHLQSKDFTESQDFASLPPIITSVTETNSNSDMKVTDKDDGNRRYSDPCVAVLPDVARPANAEIESGSEESSDLSGSQVGSRLVTCLLDQISNLKLANERLSKELLDTKVELETYRQHTLLQKGPPSSLGGTPNHTLNDNMLLGGQYPPGYLTDLVREIRDASRMREDAFYSRIRAMVHERTENGISSSETKYIEKSLDEIKSSLRASEADRRRMLDRIHALEDEMKIFKTSNGSDVNETKLTNGNLESTDSELNRLQTELAEMRKAKQNAEDHAHKLERLVTQLRSKFNGLQITNGPDSLPSEPEHDTNHRIRRTSANSSTVIFGPVTDL